MLPLPVFGAGDERRMEVEVWVQVLEFLSECLPVLWRDCYVPIMGESREPDCPSHP